MIVIPERPFVRNLEEYSLDSVLLTLNGISCPVRKCRVSAVPFNRAWNGKQRPLEQTEYAGFVLFSGDEAVKAVYEAEEDFEQAVVRPLSAGVEVKKTGRKVEFTLEKPGQYVLELDSSRRSCCFFFDPVTEYPESSGATYCFGPGIHAPGTLHLHSGDSVYIDAGAMVFASIYGEDVHGARIYGGGVLNGAMENRLRRNCIDHLTKSTVKFFNSSDISVEGITILDSSSWSMNFFGCSNVKISRVKIVGQWRYNTDGIDLINSDHVTIDDSFVRSFDDSIVLKGMDGFDFDPIPWQKGRAVTDIRIANCVLWCDWGKTLEIGAETAAPEYARIRFENCDLIHNSGDAMNIFNGHWAEVHDVIFRDIRVELQQNAMAPMIQTDDSQVYDNKGKMYIPALISMDNRPFSSMYSTSCENAGYGSIHDITFEEIKVYADPGVPVAKIPVVVNNFSDTVRFENLTIKALFVNDIPITSPEMVNTKISGNVAPVVWKKRSITNGKFAYLAIGNSVTLHGKCGYWWDNRRGMAASEVEKDYVHLVKAELEKRHGEVLLSAYNFAHWELLYYDRAEAFEMLDPYLHDELNLITLQLGENVQNHSTFREDYKALLLYLQEKAPRAKVIAVGEVSSEERNQTKKEVAAELGIAYSETGVIFSVPGYEAGMGTMVAGDDGKWYPIDHEGVAGHPGDGGMAFMAEKIIEKL